MKTYHVKGKLNGFVDAVRRGLPSLTLDTHLKKYFPTNKSALACLLTGRPIGTEGRFTALSPKLTAVITRILHIIRTKYATPSKV